MLLGLGCIHLEQTSVWPAFQCSSSLHVHITLLSIPQQRNKKFSRWTFTSLTHVSYNPLYLLYGERYLHSTSPWKALVNFTFVLNELYYIYPCSKLYNASRWRELRTPLCRNASTAKEKQSFSWHSFDHMQFQLNNREKYLTVLIKETVYCMLVFYSQEATCHRLEQNKLQQFSVHHLGMCVPSFIV